VPLVIVDPRMPRDRHGRINGQMTLSVDLAPTILRAAGITPPRTMQGWDISTLYLPNTTPDDTPAWRTEFFYEHPTIRNRNFIPASQALVRKDFKYMYWPEYDVEQLFDLSADPHEENDLAGDPTKQAKLVEMRKRFKELNAAAK
jgi:arylsulfatase